jgi:geranylgeranyl diphosphate synthase, type II
VSARTADGRPASPPATGAEALYPVDLQERVESYLERVRFGAHDATARLDEAMRYSLLAGGKRIRPVLALATAEALGHDPEHVLPFAAAIEMIHTYSLIHDDLPAMDDDELRRGKPTCHVAYGEGVAILAGDGLFAEALNLASSEQRGEPADVIAAMRELTAAAGVNGMVGGQFLDVTAVSDLDPAGLRRLHELKTGRLIAASVGCVVLLCGATGPATIGLARFAAELGVLFQIVDDILDVTGDDAALGKPSGSDARHGKGTYVSVFGLERARELALESHAEARAALARAEARTERLERIADYILTRQT